jgi:N-methylhydantoinase A/oxoprolinase/acetone carboxylase beta subunit
MGPDGVLLALGESGADAALDAVAATEPEAVAVCLLHAYRHPEHEQALGRALAARLPGVHVSLSHEAVGTFREFERAATTEVDAALSPLLGEYLRRLVDRARGRRAAGTRGHAVLRRARVGRPRRRPRRLDRALRAGRRRGRRGLGGAGGR